MLQHLLQFLAILDEPAPVGLIVQCLNRAGMRDEGGHALTNVRVLSLLSELRQQELITVENRCSPASVEPLTRRALQEGMFSRLADTVQREASLQGISKWPLRAFRLRRLLRLAIYSQDFELLEEAQQLIAASQERLLRLFGPTPLAVQLLLTPFDSAWLERQSISFQFYLINQGVHACISQAMNEDDFFTYLNGWIVWLL